MKGKWPVTGVLGKAAAALLLSVVSATAMAQFSGSITVVSDYDYRGYSQTDGDWALQGSAAYSHESGFYGSVWASSLDWGPSSDADIEVDWVVGYTNAFGDSGVNYDVGLLYYDYPGVSEADFLEIYAGLSWSLFRIKLSWSDDFAGFGASGWYLDGGVAYDWENGFGVFAYAGYSFGDVFSYGDGLPFGAPDYLNYGLGAKYTVGDHFTFDARLVGTDQSGVYKISDGVFENDARGIVSVTFAFP
jgi:uncharacterized protein (TIGR02001 family)